MISFTLVALTPAASYAQSQTFTQAGTWSAVVPQRLGAPGTFVSPRIQFPIPFGGTPNIIITGIANFPSGQYRILPLNTDYLSTQGTASDGFSPVLRNLSVNNGGTTVTGTWTAVGPNSRDTFTQVGTWSAVVPQRLGAPGTFVSPRIQFPAPFGGTPSVIITGISDGYGPQPIMPLNSSYLSTQGIASDGFSPVLNYLSANNHGTTVTGTWTAVGPNSRDTFTQVGTWSAVVPQRLGAPGTFVSPRIQFPAPFGGTPSVIITGIGNLHATGNGPWPFQPLAPDYLSIQGAAPDGFSPVLNYLSANNGGTTVTGNWTAVGPNLYNGTALAKYIVLTVIYAPPGTNGGRSTSSVAYGAGSTAGTTTSAETTFQQANEISYQTQGGFFGNGGGVGLSFGWSNSTTDNKSIQITKSVTSTLTRPGPAKDGIDHDEDTIILELNPTINLALSSSSVAWSLASNSSPPLELYVGELNGHDPMPPGVAAELSRAGITSQDYPTILARDPLASGSANSDPARLINTNWAFPYEPPLTANDPVISETNAISNSSISTVGSASQDTYKVGLSISGSAGFTGIAQSTLKDTSSWQWTDKSSVSNTAGSTQSASLTIGGPAYGYKGPVVIDVYEDTVYHTFAFVFDPVADREVAVAGTVVDKHGSLQRGTRVTLDENGVKHNTLTNAKGEYTFYGALNGPADLMIAGVKQAIPQSKAVKTKAAKKFLLRMP